jgi:glycosyltransferase involved in cell wall biosynthesis
MLRDGVRRSQSPSNAVAPNDDSLNVTELNDVPSGRNGKVSAHETLYDLHFIGPLPDKHGKVGGVGLYNLRFIEALATHASQSARIWVHAQVTFDPKQAPTGERITVTPAWRPGPLAFLGFFRILRAKPGIAFFHYEVSLYGSALSSILLSPIIALFRLKKWKVHILLHHVMLPEFSTQAMREWKTPSPLDGPALFLLKLNQQVISRVANIAIVHEGSQAQALPIGRTIIIPHGISVRPSRRNRALQTHVSNDRPLTIGVFGFIAPYKGVLDVILAVGDLLRRGAPLALNIIGGAHPRMKASDDYQQFLTELNAIAAQYPQITLHGYLPADQLDSAILENDIMLLPYRSTVGSSGALSYILGLGMPVAVSDYLASFMDLPFDIPRFKPTRAALRIFIKGLLSQARVSYDPRLTSFAEERSWANVARRYRELINDESTA